MTNKERLISLLGFSPAANSAEGGLLDVGIDPSAVYDSANILTLKAVAVGLMKVLLTTADTSNVQTGFAVKYDRAAILKLIDLYETELSDSGSNRIIKAIRPW